MFHLTGMLVFTVIICHCFHLVCGISVAGPVAAEHEPADGGAAQR